MTEEEYIITLKRFIKELETETETFKINFTNRFIESLKDKIKESEKETIRQRLLKDTHIEKSNYTL